MPGWDPQAHASAPANLASRGLQFSPILLVIYVAVIMAYGYMRLANQTHLTALMTTLTIALMFCTSFVHMVETHGVRRAVLMAAAAFAITLTAELIGVSTGVLFGNYTYSDQLGLKVFGLVPLVIPLAWLMMLYPAFETAALLLPRPPARAQRSLRTLGTNALLALTAAAAMTAWDLSLDPRMVSDGNWTWRNGGSPAYFGIPLSNFAGWLVTAFVIYLLWLWLARAQDHALARPSRMLRRVYAMVERLASVPGAMGMTRHLARPLRSPVWTSLPVYIYIITWLGESIVNVVLWHSPLVGMAVFIGMGIFSLPALARLWHIHSDTRITIGQSLRSLGMRQSEM
jgi:uncharacterized membrane protein